QALLRARTVEVRREAVGLRVVGPGIGEQGLRHEPPSVREKDYLYEQYSVQMAYLVIKGNTSSRSFLTLGSSGGRSRAPADRPRRARGRALGGAGGSVVPGGGGAG